MSYINKSLHQPLGPLEAKAKPLEEGVSFAWDVGIHDALSKCDSKMVIDAVLGNHSPLLTIENIKEGI